MAPSRTIHRHLLRIACSCLVLASAMTSAGGAQASPRSSQSASNIWPSGSGMVSANAAITHAGGQTGSAAVQPGSGAPPSAANAVSPVSPGGFTAPAALQPARLALKVSVVPLPSTTSTSSLAGINQNDASGVTPSDANGTAGSNSYLETTNRVFDIFSRSGTLEYTDTYLDWFASVRGQNTTLYDPNVVWDTISNRYLFSVATGTSFLLSVAKGADPRGPSDFCLYNFPTLTGLGSDFDKLGYNNEGVYFSVNENVGGGPVNNELFFVNRQRLESCGQNIPYTTWSRLTNLDGTMAQAIVPAVQYTGSSSVEYLVNSKPAGACILTLWTLNPAASPPALARVTVNTQCYAPPPNAPQANSAATIYAGDSSVSHVTYVNGLLSLDVAGSYDFGDGNGPVGIAEWFILNPTGTTKLAHEGAFGTPGAWLMYPAVARTFNGKLMFVYDATSVNMSPSIFTVEFENGAYTAPVSLIWGKSAFGQSGAQPWGDYQSAWLDPAGPNPDAVWLTGQYATSGGIWGTEYALVAS